jgi:hypothetical protein
VPRDNPRIWGATPEECAATYPCDGLDFPADDVFFRAVEIRAPADLVSRWVRQLKVAPYSYDWLDNFGRRSPPKLTPDLAPLAPDNRLMTIFRVVEVDQGDLTIRLASALGRVLMGDFAGTYRVATTSKGSRLIAKVLVRYPSSFYGGVLRRSMPQLDLVMFRKQLLTLKSYAERDWKAAEQSGSDMNPLLP